MPSATMKSCSSSMSEKKSSLCVASYPRLSWRRSECAWERESVAHISRRSAVKPTMSIIARRAWEFWIGPRHYSNVQCLRGRGTMASSETSPSVTSFCGATSSTPTRLPGGAVVRSGLFASAILSARRRRQHALARRAHSLLVITPIDETPHRRGAAGVSRARRAVARVMRARFAHANDRGPKRERERARPEAEA